MAVLIGMSDEVKGKTFEIKKDKLTIGRNASNLIVLEHPTCSSRHCCIVKNGNDYVVTDLNSTNGTRVNSKEISEAMLHAKDLLQVGSVEFMFDSEEGTAAEAPVSSRPAIEVTSGPATAPISFGSISPFGGRRKDTAKMWWLLIGIVGTIAIALVVWLMIKLMAPSS